MGSGHIGGALSVTDLLVTLYFKVLRTDPQRPDHPDRAGAFCPKAMLASQHKLHNLIAFVDHNKMQIDGTLKDINDVALALKELA